MKNSLLLAFVLFIIVTIGFSTYLVQSPQVPGKFADEIEEPVVDVAQDAVIEEKKEELVADEVAPTDAQTQIESTTAVVEPTIEPTIEPSATPEVTPTEPLIEPTTVVTTPTGTSSQCYGDINSDGIVDSVDIDIIKSNYGQTACGTPGDIDNNCIVNIHDYGLLVKNFACRKE